MKQIYNKELDELLFQQQGKGYAPYNQDEKENIFLESLKDGVTLFDLTKKIGRSGMAILNILTTQYPEGREVRLPKAEGEEILEELKTYSIKAICTRHNINPKKIGYLLVSRAYAKDKKYPETRGSWTQEEDDFIYSAAKRRYDALEEEGKPKRLREADIEGLRKEYKNRFGQKRSYNSIRTRVVRLNAIRNSLGYLARSPTQGQVAPQRRPRSVEVRRGDSFDLKEFKEWVQRKGIEIYLKEKTDQLRKEVAKGGI